MCFDERRGVVVFEGKTEDDECLKFSYKYGVLGYGGGCPN